MSQHFVVTVAILATTAFLSGIVARRIPEPLVEPLSRVRSEILGWKAVTDRQLTGPTLHALAPTDYLSRIYARENSRLDLFIAYYAQQRAGESMHSPKHCLPGAGWEIWKHDSALVPVGDQQVSVNKYSIQNLGTRMVMLYWYQSHERIISNEYVGKLLLARDTLLTGRTAGSIVRIMVADVPGATDYGIAFAAGIIPEIQRCLTGQKVSLLKLSNH